MSCVCVSVVHVCLLCAYLCVHVCLLCAYLCVHVCTLHSLHSKYPVIKNVKI